MSTKQQQLYRRLVDELPDNIKVEAVKRQLRRASNGRVYGADLYVTVTMLFPSSAPKRRYYMVGEQHGINFLVNSVRDKIIAEYAEHLWSEDRVVTDD